MPRGCPRSPEIHRGWRDPWCGAAFSSWWLLLFWLFRRIGLLLFELTHSFAGDLKLRIRRLLRLLDEAVQSQQPAFDEAEQDPRYPVAGQVTAHFPQSITERAA